MTDCRYFLLKNAAATAALYCYPRGNAASGIDGGQVDDQLPASPSSGTAGREQSAERLMGEASTNVLIRRPRGVCEAHQARGAEAAKR